MHDFYAAIQGEARSTRLLVTMPLWFRPQRLTHFLDIVRTLSDFPVAKMKVVIYTNTIDPDELATLDRLIDCYRTEEKSFDISCCPALLGQYDLCWQHRQLITDVFLNLSERYTHFIYFEDDIRFSFLNFCYFLYYREYLRPQGVLPAFVRVEYNKEHRMFYATDIPKIMDFGTTLASIARKRINAGPYVFVPFDNAYMAMYVLDQDLAREFVASRSFDPEKSKEVVSWGIPERAAAGLCLENPPDGYITRYVVAIEPHSQRPACCSWIYHLQNNFTDLDNATNPWGRIAMDSLFSLPVPRSERRSIEPWNPPRSLRGSPVGSFNSDALETVAEFRTFIEATGSTERIDLRYSHAPRTLASIVTQRLRRDSNWFGPGQTRAIDVFKDGSFRMQESETLILNDALFSPQSSTVASLSRGFYDASIANFYLLEPTLEPLAKIDPLYELNSDGECVFSERFAALDYVDVTVIPICGTGFHNYGHFLYDSLPAVQMFNAAIHAGAADVVGPPLAAWQSEILEMLGLLGRYRTLHAPAVFRRIIVSSQISFHVSYPTRFARPVFDMLRFIAGGPSSPRNRKIFVSRRHDVAKRVLVNRDEVEELFRLAGFDIISPEGLTVLEQIRLFSSCVFVAGESGAAMANLGFCDPGTRVLEIQPQSFVEGWTRAACMLFGHEWRVFFATCPVRLEPGGSAKPALEFVVDVEEMKAVINGWS